MEGAQRKHKVLYRSLVAACWNLRVEHKVANFVAYLRWLVKGIVAINDKEDIKVHEIIFHFSI